MQTFKMLNMYHTSGHVDNCYKYGTRQGIYGQTFAFAPRYTSRYMIEPPTDANFASHMFGGPLILMQRITEWTSEQIECAKRKIALYKQMRHFISNGAKVVHLLPRTQAYYNFIKLWANNCCGYYWDAIQSVNKEQTQSIVFVYEQQVLMPL